MGCLMAVRLALVVTGALAIVGGVALAVSGEPGGAFAGFWLVVTGLIFLVAVALERMRYRSLHAEQTLAPPGPGGGEATDAPLEPRFRSTDEVFIDPTSRIRMRVWLDPISGERRYRADE
jgi:hypothetical protein